MKKVLLLIPLIIFNLFLFTPIIQAQGSITAGPQTSTNCPKVYIGIDPNNADKTQTSMSISDLLGNTGIKDLQNSNGGATNGATINTVGSRLTYNDLGNSHNSPTDPSTYTIDINHKDTRSYYIKLEPQNSYGNIITPDVFDKGVKDKTISPSDYTALTYSILYTKFGTTLSNISCPPSFKDLQTLFMRLLIIVDTIVGLVIFYVFAKAAIIRMTSRGNPDAIKKSTGMITGAIGGLAIVLGAYIVLILIGTRLLPSNPCYNFSFVDSARILFLFDQSNISPNLIDQPTVECNSTQAG